MRCIAGHVAWLALATIRCIGAGHAWYEFASSTHATAFEAMSATQVWDRTSDTNHTFVYGALEFFFENGVTGYFGGQHQGLGPKTVDFAIWDSCAGSKNKWNQPCSTAGGSSQPMDARYCSRFGNEGSGSHCGRRGIELFKGREYSFHVELSMRNSTGAAWTASMVDEYAGNETEIGTLFVTTDPTNPPPAGSIEGYGGLTTAVCSTCPHMRNRTEPTDPDPYGGISFQEYFLGGSFYSSFGWIGPRFFPLSSRRGGVDGAAVRRDRGPASAREDGVVTPLRIMVDSETNPKALSNISGCIPGYECGGDRVFFQMGTRTSQPPAGTHAWIWNGTQQQGASAAAALLPRHTGWQLSARLRGADIFDAFEFQPEHRNFVEWVNRTEAAALGLFGVSPDGVAFIRADNVSVADPETGGRKAVRLVSTANFSSGLWVLDAKHMPQGCGSHYAWWLSGPNWPHSGEIDVVECINGDSRNRVTLHTGPDCDMQGDDTGFLGHWNSPGTVARNCNVTGGHGGNNVGCQMRSQDNASCGAAFNQLGSGGVYVTLLLQGSTMDPYEGPPRIASWFFRRSEVPADVTASRPTPSLWRKPDVQFRLGERCSPQHFHELNMILSINFCGWAGSAHSWAQGCDTSTGCGTCEEWVGQHPQGATEVRWEVNEIAVYKWGQA